MSRRIRLANHVFEIELAPDIGGCVTAFRTLGPKAGPIFRDAPADLTDAVNASAFPLVPFCNRIRDGRFSFRGREVRLQPNMAGDPSPLHGQGWRGAWRVLTETERCVELGFSHTPGEWPWAYEARQRFQLNATGLTYTLTLHNTSSEPMPAGLGLHPYFPCDGDTVISTRVETVWTVDDKVLPVAQEPAVGRYDLHERRINGAGLDNGYGGWDGAADMRWPDRSLSVAMTSPGARFFQVYAPASGGVFVAEPVTHANAALNQPESEWPALGIVVLQPGGMMDLVARFDVSVGA
jgi:aldose 1-epimerase